MSISAERVTLLLVAALLLNSRCGAPPAQSGETLLGLHSGDALTFVTAPGGKAMSILYDAAKMEVPVNPPLPGGVKSFSRRFELLAGTTGARLRFFFRGFSFAAGKRSNRLIITVAGRTTVLADRIDDGEFLRCVDAAVSSAVLPVSWTGEVAQLETEAAILSIDAIDIGLATGDPIVAGDACADAPPKAQAK